PVRGAAGRRDPAAADGLRSAALVDGVPAGNDGDGGAVRVRRRRRRMARGPGRGAGVDRGGRLAGGRDRRGPLRGPAGTGAGGDQVHSTAMKMFAVVSSPTRPNSPLSTFSSSRFT